MADDGALLRRRADQRALTEVAVDLLRAGVGERISTTVQLQERLEVGSGTVQKAIRHLVEAGGVSLKVKGHQGTLIKELDPALVWRSAGLPPLRILLPPPGSIEATAIAVGVRDQLGKSGVTVELDFIRGASRRLTRLETRDEPAAVLISMGAAEALGSLDPTRYSWLDIGPESYYQRDSLVVLRRPGPRGRLRVARDPDSLDHVRLTELAFDPETVTFVECPFVDVPGALLDGVADAGVWHRVVMTITPEQAGLLVEPWVSRTDLEPPNFANALLLWPADRAEVGSLLSAIDRGRILQRMRELAALGFRSADVREVVPWI